MELGNPYVGSISPNQERTQNALFPFQPCDRTMQALYALALQPIAETTADSRSFGFRLFRSAQDASRYIFMCPGRKGSAPWILEGDIKGCFDNIAHDLLIENIPMDRSILTQFLKSGFIFDRNLYPTDKETIQGRIISPILANMTLDGIEKTLSARFPKMNIYFIRYADDVLVTSQTKEIAEKARSIIEEFLAERGLELSLDKSKITHIDEGFDFLRYNFQKYKGKLRVKPSQKSIKAICWKIKKLVLNARAWAQDSLIQVLNPVIRGWSNYHCHNAAKETFVKLDHYVWTVTWQWGKYRHRNKGYKWIFRKYWHSEGNRNWVFQTKENTLLQFADATIRRHNIPKLQANPYLDREYFLNRQESMKKQTPWIQTKLSFFACRPLIG